MIEVWCNLCGDQLTEPGALIISPPSLIRETVYKWHVCTKCYDTKILVNIVANKNV